MIVDVVASRQRNYRSRVKAIVANWEATNQQHSIQWLAEHPLDATRFGLSEAEVVTIFEVARKLRAFTLNEGLLGPDGEDSACGMWARGCGEFEHAPRLDPVIGCVKGIGLALFAFMRMRSGADVIKPDIRVKKAMVSLGFVVSNDDHARLVLAKAAAQEIGAFAAVERVGCYRKAQVSGLKALAMEDGDRNYCGRTADASLLRVGEHR